MNRLIRSRPFLSLLLLALTAGVVFLLSGCAPPPEAATQEQGDPSHDPGDHDPEHGEDASHTHGDDAGHTHGDDAGHMHAAEGTARSQVHTYDIRGEIVELPDPEDPLSGFYVRHEAIDEWVSMEGEIDPMDSMTMPFPLADDLSLEGIAAGDKVLFTLRVAYDDDPTFQVTRIEKLPDDTVLELRNARRDE